MAQKSPGQLSDAMERQAATDRAGTLIDGFRETKERDGSHEADFKTALAAHIPPGSRVELIRYNGRARIQWFAADTGKATVMPPESRSKPF